MTNASNLQASLPNAANIVSTLTGGLGSAATASWLVLLTDLDTDLLGILPEEVDDVKVLIDNFIQDIEAGLTAQAAWEKESTVFIASEKSQGWALFTQVMTQFSQIFDKLAAGLQTLIQAL